MLKDIPRRAADGNEAEDDFRDEVERLEAEQADYLTSLEDDGKVVAGPESWFKSSPWNSDFPGRRAFIRFGELSAERERRGEPAAPGMLMMAGDYLARKVTEHLGGEWHGHYGLAPGPGHSKADRSLQISPHQSDPDDVVLHSHCGDDWRSIKDDLRAHGILRELKERTSPWKPMPTSSICPSPSCAISGSRR